MALPHRTSANPYASTFSPATPSPGSAAPPYIQRTSSYGFPATNGPGGQMSGAGAGRAGAPAAGAYGGASAGGFRPGRLVKRMFKFPQMDFEVAMWEMVNLMIAPRKVWRQVFYRKQTKNTYATSDPAFPYLLSFFLLLTSLAWSLAYAAPSFPNILRIAFWFVFVHCLGACLVSATLMWLLVGRALGPGGFLVNLGMGGRRRGLFGLDASAVEGVEWGFAFDVAIRSFLPTWVYLYVLQFLLLPAVTSRYWVSTLLTNLLHFGSAAQSTYIAFLGYNSIPSLSSTHLLLAPPLMLYGLLFLIATVSGWNASLHLAPILWCAGGLRKVVGGA